MSSPVQSLAAMPDDGEYGQEAKPHVCFMRILLVRLAKLCEKFPSGPRC